MFLVCMDLYGLCWLVPRSTVASVRMVVQWAALKCVLKERKEEREPTLENFYRQNSANELAENANGERRARGSTFSVNSIEYVIYKQHR